MRRTNELTQKALNSSDDTLQKTLSKMQGQIDATNKLYGEAQKQTAQAQRLADQSARAAKAADRQADAAKSSAETARQSVQTAKDAMYTEQRPWVGIEVVPATLPANFIKAGAGNNASAVIIFAHNTGRTPALRWRSECCETPTRTNEEVVPDYDTLRSDPTTSLSPRLQEFIRLHPASSPAILQGRRAQQSLENGYFAETEQVIPPNGTWNLDIATVKADDHMFHYMIGKMVYWDVLDRTREHITKFCLVSFGNGPIRLCKSGQDMN
jgi:hypothetical protein